MRSRWKLSVTLLGIVTLAATTAAVRVPGAAARTQARPAGLAAGPSWGSAPGDWASWEKDLSGSRYAAAETAITPRTVSHLEYKWAFTFPLVSGVNPGSQPAVVGDTLYVGSTDAKFYALDAKTGATKWVYDLTSVAGPADDNTPDPVRDGPAVAGGYVYFGDSRGYVFALNRYTGRLEWDTRLDSNGIARITASPTVFDGKVFIGVSQQEAGLQLQNLDYPCCSGRGQMAALDARTGAIVWRHYTVGVPQPVGTWPSGATDYAPSGGSVEDAVAVDPVNRTLYFGTGENASGTTGETDSVVALSVDTGKLRWYYKAQIDTYTVICDLYPQYAGYCPQAANGTDHDWDMSSSPNLFRIGGREVVGIGEKSGVYRVLDANTGQLIWSDQLTTHPDVTGGSAGIQWGTSYDGNHLYVATWADLPGNLYALDPATGAVLWKTSGPADGCSTGGAVGQSCGLAFTPAVTTSPGLVYEGSADGKMYIFSSATGKLLWQYDTVRQFQGVNGVVGEGQSLSGLGGAVVANGMVYVQSGYYPINVSDTTEGTVMLAFALPGQGGEDAGRTAAAPRH